MHAEVGQAYADAGLPREAIAEYEKAVGLCPQFADLRTRLGTLLREINELRARATSTRPPRARGPSYVPARIQLGVTLLSLGESRRGARAVEQGARDRAGERAGEDVPAHDDLRVEHLAAAAQGVTAVPDAARSRVSVRTVRSGLRSPHR